MEDLDEVVYKVIVVGDASVGKTSLARRYCTGQFDQNYTFTLGVDFFAKSLIVKDNPIRLMIYDTAGQERFDFIRGLYFEGAAGAVIAYDVTNKTSFERVEYWLKQVQERCKGVPLILVATKVDLDKERVVSNKEGTSLAKNLGMLFLESSSKSNFQVNDVFQLLANEIWKLYEKSRRQ
ncbi:MAG: Rab family GTPase [Promethearchaeota archaeon]